MPELQREQERRGDKPGCVFWMCAGKQLSADELYASAFVRELRRCWRRTDGADCGPVFGVGSRRDYEMMFGTTCRSRGPMRREKRNSYLKHWLAALG